MSYELKLLRERLREVYKENVDLKAENVRLKKSLGDAIQKISKLETILKKYTQQKRLIS